RTLRWPDKSGPTAPPRAGGRNVVIPAQAGIQCHRLATRWVPAFAGTTTVATAALFLLREIPGIHLDECVGADIFPQRRIDVLGRRRCDLRVDFCVVEECAAEIGLARKLAGEPAVLRPRQGALLQER